MTHILFVCIDRSDVSTLGPVFSRLRAAKASYAFVSGYMGAVDDAQVDGARIRRPPLPRAPWLLGFRKRRALGAANDDEDRRNARAWMRTLPAFLDDAIRRERPDLVVLPPPDIEPSLAAEACERSGARYVCFLPQYYEFKYDAFLQRHPRAEAYLVSGDLGRERLARLGVEKAAIRVVGNPKFDATRTHAQETSSETGLILYASQGLPENRRLFDRLCRYISERSAARLWLRPHPEEADLSAYVEIRARHGVTAEIAPTGSLLEQLGRASALVTLTSNTLLDALLMGVPSIMWDPACTPARVPFAVDGYAHLARDYGELSTSLDAMLFEPTARRNWLSGCASAPSRYFGSGLAAERFTDALLELATQRARVPRASPA